MSSIAPFYSSFLSCNHSHKPRKSVLSFSGVWPSPPIPWLGPQVWAEQWQVWVARWRPELRSVSAHLTSRATMVWAGSISQVGACHPPVVYTTAPCGPAGVAFLCWACGPLGLVSTLPGVLVFSSLHPIPPLGLGLCHPSERPPEVPLSGTTLTLGLTGCSRLVRHWCSMATAQHFVVTMSLHLNPGSGQDLFF